MPEWQDRFNILKMCIAQNPHTLTDKDLKVGKEIGEDDGFHQLFYVF